MGQKLLPAKINFPSANRVARAKDRTTFPPCLITPDHFISLAMAFAS